MSELKFYCPKCGSFWYFSQREKWVKDNFGDSHCITFHPVPKECFKCYNRYMEVLTLDEIQELGLTEKDCSSW